jgi:hypothetical protein
VYVCYLHPTHSPSSSDVLGAVHLLTSSDAHTHTHTHTHAHTQGEIAFLDFDPGGEGVCPAVSMARPCTSVTFNLGASPFRYEPFRGANGRMAVREAPVQPLAPEAQAGGWGTGPDLPPSAPTTKPPP